MIYAVIIAFLAGALAMYLFVREAREYLSVHGKPGCAHAANLKCGDCDKTVLSPACPACKVLSPPFAAKLMLCASPTDPKLLRVTLALSPDFAPWIDLTQETARGFLVSAITAVDGAEPEKPATVEFSGLDPVEAAKRLP